jgi:hypothetical protein
LEALQAVYPEIASELKPKATGYWNNKDNQKAFFDKLAIKLNIQKLEDWNNVTSAMVMREEGSAFIIHYYKSSLKQGIE